MLYAVVSKVESVAMTDTNRSMSHYGQYLHNEIMCSGKEPT